VARPREEVVRFAVGSADGPRSTVWRIWTDQGNSDVYQSGEGVPVGMDISQGIIPWQDGVAPNMVLLYRLCLMVEKASIARLRK
jgi:hypothetical protein